MNEDEQGVRYREFVSSRDLLQQRIHAIELEQARLNAALMSVPQQLADLSKELRALSQQVAKSATPAETQDHTILALHRALDKVGTGGGGSFERLLLLALTAVCSFFAARFFIGGL